MSNQSVHHYCCLLLRAGRCDQDLGLSRAGSFVEAAELVGDVICNQESHQATASSPCTEVAIEAWLKGTYALKGIAGQPLLSELVPVEISAALSTIEPR